MRNRIHASAALLICCSLATGSASADSATVKKELNAAYARIAKAMRSKDPATIMASTTGDYVQIDVSGKKRSRAEMKDDHKQTFAAAESITMSAKISKVVAKGSTAVAEVKWAVNMVTKPAVDPQGQPHRVNAVVNLRHTWVKTPEGWRLRFAQELPGSTLIVDGKPQAIQRS